MNGIRYGGSREWSGLDSPSPRRVLQQCPRTQDPAQQRRVGPAVDSHGDDRAKVDLRKANRHVGGSGRSVTRKPVRAESGPNPARVGFSGHSHSNLTKSSAVAVYTCDTKRWLLDIVGPPGNAQDIQAHFPLHRKQKAKSPATTNIPRLTLDWIRLIPYPRPCGWPKVDHLTP